MFFASPLWCDIFTFSPRCHSIKGDLTTLDGEKWFFMSYFSGGFFLPYTFVTRHRNSFCHRTCRPLSHNILYDLGYPKIIENTTLMQNSIMWVQNGLSCRDPLLWQYGLWSFQSGGIKLERFLPKKRHTQRKLMNFENWVNGEVSKIGCHSSNKVI